MKNDKIYYYNQRYRMHTMSMSADGHEEKLLLSRTFQNTLCS